MGLLKFMDTLVQLGHQYPFSVTLRPQPFWSEWLVANVTLAEPLHARVFVEDASFEGLCVMSLAPNIYQVWVPVD